MDMLCTANDIKCIPMIVEGSGGAWGLDAEDVFKVIIIMMNTKIKRFTLKNVFCANNVIKFVKNVSALEMVTVNHAKKN